MTRAVEFPSLAVRGVDMKVWFCNQLAALFLIFG
jgi:hypothetical protein